MHWGTSDGTSACSAGRGYGGVEGEVVEQVGDLEQAGVVAWGCGLCQGHLPAAAATVVVAVADTVVGRAGTVVVVVVVVVVAVVVVAAAVASTVAAVASDPVIYYVPELKAIRHIVARMAMEDTILCLVCCHIPICILRRESKGIQGHEGCKDIG
ncbi:hypothetical protein Taro_010485 [Colocasia esculenta]|uniref:Uncharacterized protein n=1 Tax=Colocasia esculenta TaxID=4460 RepID=A0A843TZ18_COLES|nr:hypothetical protein [Colocasia esculenta]